MSFAHDINHFVYYTTTQQSEKEKKKTVEKQKRKQDGRLRVNSFCRSLPMAKNSRVSSNNTNAHVSKPQTTSARSYLNATCWQEMTSPAEHTSLKKWQPAKASQCYFFFFQSLDGEGEKTRRHKENLESSVCHSSYVATITRVRPINNRFHLGWKFPSSLLGRSLPG